MPDPSARHFGPCGSNPAAILARLTAGEASVTELAKPFGMSLPSICKHLRVLEDAGLIARRRDGKWRPRRLEAAPLHQVADWVQHYRQSGNTNFDHPHKLRELDPKQPKYSHEQVRK